eukprot:4144598-Ditylum_brightwellii.AAC.1
MAQQRGKKWHYQKGSSHLTSYSCMIKGTTIKETVEAKTAYERILHEYGHKVEACHGDNSRFDSADIQTAY